MQNQSIFPNCLCCGEHLEAKHRILDGLFQCPTCKNEHYFVYDFTPIIVSQLSEADQLRNNHHYEDALKKYQFIAKNNTNLIEAQWGMFLSVYGIVYVKENKVGRYIPSINQFVDEKPTESKYYLKTIDMAKDPYMKKIYIKECEFIAKSWDSAKSTIKKVKTKIIKEPEAVEVKPVETKVKPKTVEKEIGSAISKGYKIDPIIENKIKSAEQIYLQNKKFNRALKTFDDIIKTDPLAEKARWNKILSTLEVVTFDELNPKAKLDSVFEMFDELMGCINSLEDQMYLQAFESHLLKKLIEVSEFDNALYDFIDSWKKKGEKSLFANLVYQEIENKLKNSQASTVDWIHPALASVTKEFSKNDSRFVTKYIEMAERINHLGFYKDALILIDNVLKENPNHVKAIIIQLCANYKVAKLSDLHKALKDLKFIDTLKLILKLDDKATEVFKEVRYAIVSLINQGNYKLANQMINHYINLLPKDEKETLVGSLLEFSKHLIYFEQFKDASKYVKIVIENDKTNATAHWAKFMIALKAHTHFELLMLTRKKDLMKYPDYEHAVNATSDHKEYIRFYEIQDKLKQATPENNMFRKMAKRNFIHFDNMCQHETLHEFTDEVFPQIEKEIPVLFIDEQMSVINIFNRSMIMILITLFSLTLSHMKELFDPSNSSDSNLVSSHVISLFKDDLVYVLVPIILISYLVVWIIEKETVLKGLAKGLTNGLIALVVSLVFLAGIPWILTKFLTQTLFGLSPYIIPSGTFGLALIGSFFILKISHQKLVVAKVNHRFIRASFINLIVLAGLLIVAFIATMLSIIL